MKESKGVYVTKKDIRQNINRGSHLHASRIINNELGEGEQRSFDVGIQYNSKKDNLLVCTCKNYPGIRRQHEARYFSTTRRQIYTYPNISRSITEIGIGSVKTLPKKKVKRVHLPETDDRGVGCTDLCPYYESINKKPRYNKVPSYYDKKRTSSKCVGGVVENTVESFVSARVSPIIITKSGTTSPKEQMSNKFSNIELGTNTIEKIFVTTTTQMENDLIIESKTKPSTTVTVIVRSTATIKESEKEKLQSNYLGKKVVKSFSSDSLVQHVHNLEHPSEDKYNEYNIGNTREIDYQIIFQSNSKTKENEISIEKQKSISSELKSTSLLRRRFQALRKSLSKKEDSKTNESKSSIPSIRSVIGSVKDASVTSDPPSLVGKSYFNLKASFKNSPHSSDSTQQCDTEILKDLEESLMIKKDDPLQSSKDSTPEKYEDTQHSLKDSRIPEKKEDAQQLPKLHDSMIVDSEYGQGVKGMFKLWGKKFNLEDESRINNKKSESPKSSFAKKKEKKEVPLPKLDSSASPPHGEKKEGKKFFFFKKKNKHKKAEKAKDTYKNKKGVTTGRCEVRDGLLIKFGGNSPPPSVVKSKINVSREIESYGEIIRKDWLRKYMANSPIESQNSVKIRWNNNTYATSSSTILELMEHVYKGTGVTLKSKSEITSSVDDTCIYKAYTNQNQNYAQEVEAWMIPRTIPDHPVILRDNKIFCPVMLRDRPLSNSEDNLNLTLSDRKWFIEKSKAFAHKIKVVLHSNNIIDLKNRHRSSDYLRIDIPKGFFSDTSTDDPLLTTQTSDEEVYKIVEYDNSDSITQTARIIKPTNTAPTQEPIIELKSRDPTNKRPYTNTPQGMKNTVSQKDVPKTQSIQVGERKSINPKPCYTSLDCILPYLTKPWDTVTEKTPAFRDVVIQDSNVYIPKICDVIGVGIITQRELRDPPKPILKLTEYLSDDESDPNTHNTKTCELAEKYLQEYCRNWTGIDTLRTFSLCVSDSHIKCSSGSNSNGTKSLPDMGDDYTTSSCLSSCSMVITEFPDRIGNNLEGLNKSSSKYLESDHLSYRVLPKDSVEVFKTRKKNAMSNKSKWINDKLESSSYLEYSDHILEIRSSLDCIRRRRKKTTTKRVMIPDGDIMNEILTKSHAPAHGILSYSDMTTRNNFETVGHVKTPIVDAGSIHDNSLLRDVSCLKTGPEDPPMRGENKRPDSFVVKSPLNLQVSSKTQAMEIPSTIVIDLERDVSHKSLNFRDTPKASQEPIIRTKSNQSHASNKLVEVHIPSPKTQSSAHYETIDVKLCKSLSNNGCTKFRGRSVGDINKKQSIVTLSKSRSKISQNTPEINESKSLSASDVPKSKRPSKVSLYPVGFKPSRSESQMVLNTINPNALPNSSQKVTHGIKTLPSSATIILSKRHTSLLRFAGPSLNVSSTNIIIEGNSSKKSIIKQSNQLKQNILQSSCDKCIVNNGIDESKPPKIPGRKISGSSDALSLHTPIFKHRLSYPETKETIGNSSPHHISKLSEFLNWNVVDPESPPVTVMAESENKSDIKPIEPKKDEESEKDKEIKIDETSKKAEEPGKDKEIKKNKESKKQKEKKTDEKPKTATRGPLAHPPAVLVPGKSRCAPLVKYANPPHYKPNSPLRPQSSGGQPTVPSTAPGGQPAVAGTAPKGQPAVAGTAPGGQPTVAGTPPAPGTTSAPGAKEASNINSPAAPIPGSPPAPSELTKPGIPQVPETSRAQDAPISLGNPVSPPLEARYATTDKAMQSGSMSLRNSITQTYDYEEFRGTNLIPEPSRDKYFSRSRRELNLFTQSTSPQPVTRQSASILSTNTIAFPVSGSDSSAVASTEAAPPVRKEPLLTDTSAENATTKEVDSRAPGKSKPASDTAGLTRPLESPLQLIRTLQMLEPVVSVRIPCPHQKVDSQTHLPCPHSPTCNPPCNIPCFTPPVQKPVKEKPKKVSHCKLKPCIDLEALEIEKLELEKKFKAQFAKKTQCVPKRCTSMCRTPPCYRQEPSRYVHTGTITQPKCASSCRTSSCNPKCTDFPWATKMQVSQQASLASVHFADGWQSQEDDYDNIREYYGTAYSDDTQCEVCGFYNDACMRTDFEEKVLKVDKGLNYKQVPIYEQGRIYGRLKQGASLNLNSTLFPGYDYNQDPYYESGQNCDFGYGLNYERVQPSYVASAYDPNCDRQYANYSQYQNYDSKMCEEYYEQSSYHCGQNLNNKQCNNYYDHCPNYELTHDQMPRYEDAQTCDQTQNCQYHGFDDQSASENVEEDVEKCYPYSIGVDTTRRKTRVYKDNCTKKCSFKPEPSQTGIEMQTKKKIKEPRSLNPEYVIPQFKHPCSPIEFGKDVCPPPACPPAKQCPFTCSSRGKISGIHLRQEPIFVPKKTCDPTCKAWNTVEQATKTDFSVWGDLGPKDHDLIKMKSVNVIVSPREHPRDYRKIIDPDGVTIVDRKDYVTHHSTPVLNNVFEMKHPITVNDMRSDGKMLPEAKKEDIETSLTNMFEINFNLRVTRGDKTTEISIANEDDTNKIKTPKDSRELIAMRGESPKVTEENTPNDINIRIMIKSYKPKSEIPLRELTVNDFSKEISKKFHTVSTGSKLTGTEEMADHVYSVHRTTLNIADTTEASKNESENKDQIISPKIVLNPCKVTEKGDIMLDKEPRPVEIESKCLPKIDQLNDTTSEICDTHQEVMVKYSDKVRQSETAENIIKYKVTSSTANSSSLQNIDLHSILKEDDSCLKLGSSHIQVIRLYKSDANICGTDTDVSSYNKTSTERTDYDNKASEDYLNLKTSDEPALEDIKLALKTSTEPTSESQQGVEEAILPKESREIRLGKKEMLNAIFEKASCLKKSKGKNRIRKLKKMLKAVLTSDSSDPDDVTTSSNCLAKDFTYKSLKTNLFKDSDSLNNYLKLSGKESVVQVQCNTVEPSSNCSGGDSEWSIDTGEIKTTNQCICSAVAARLKSYDNNMNDLACCCQKNSKADQQISCDLIPLLDDESSSVECVDVEIQNNFLSSKIVISQSVEIAAPSSNFFLINNPIVAHAESVCIRSKVNKEEKIREVRIKRSKMSLMQSGDFKDYDLRKYNKSPKLGISDDDKIIFLETQPVTFPNLVKGSKRKEKTRHLNWQQPADILQLYETKKAVLEIYTEKTVTEDGERLVAKLPKFVYEKESEICKSYENSQSKCKGFRSLCKTNIVMSIAR